MTKPVYDLFDLARFTQRLTLDGYRAMCASVPVVGVAEAGVWREESRTTSAPIPAPSGPLKADGDPVSD